MAFCDHCGRAYYPDGTGCPACLQLYYTDLNANNFPHLIREASREHKVPPLGFFQWSELKKLEERLFRMGKTDAEIDAEIDKWSQQLIDRWQRHLAIQREKQAEDGAKSERIRNRRYI